MGVINNDKKLVIITETKTIHSDLTKDVSNNLTHEIDFILKHNQVLAEHTIKNKFVDFCSNISMETIFMNMENSKTNEPHKY